MKIKLFTHTDFDGIGCAIIGKIVFGENVDIEYCDYDDVNEKIKDFVEHQQYLNYDFIYITDISVNTEVSELIENEELCTFNLRDRFQLLDHHPTALELNKYEWCKVIVEEDGEKTSGTKLFYNYLSLDIEVNFNEWINDNLFDFAEIVRKYDTYLWKTKYHDVHPKMWNDLLYIIGRDNFIEQIVYKIRKSTIEFSDIDLKLLLYKQLEIDKYIEEKSKTIIEKDILGYKAGVVFAESYHSELGNKLAENNPQLDFIVLINPSTSISYRSVKDNINLGKDIASVFGGGGHPLAAGSPLDKNIIDKLIDDIFKL